nr:hypothetical protein [Tanacetum cinerariifolium]
MTRSSTKELLLPYENSERVLGSKRKLFNNPSLVESNSPELDQLFEIKVHIEEEVIEIMAETMEQYMCKNQEDYRGAGSEHEDAKEHSEMFLEIIDLFHIPKVTQDQIMLRAFPVSLTGASCRWLQNQPSGSITTWEVLKTKKSSSFTMDSKGAIPSKTAVGAKIAIQEMVEYSQKWHNGTSSKTKSTKTSDGLAAIQAQLNNLE